MYADNAAINAAGNNKNKTKGVIEMLLCAALWSIGGIFIKLIPFNALAIVGIRSLIAAMTMLIYMLCGKFKFTFTKRALRSGIYMCCLFVFFVVANKLTSAANAIVLQFTSPMFVLLFSAVYKKQRFSGYDIAAVALTMGGIALFFFDKLDGGHLLGNIIAMLAGVFVALIFISCGDSGKDEKMSGILMGHTLAAIVGVPFVFITHCSFDMISIVSLLALGIFQLGIPYILYSFAANSCSPLTCSLLGALEPILNPVWVFIFIGEAPGMYALIGAVIVVVTISVWGIIKSRASYMKKTC